MTLLVGLVVGACSLLVLLQLVVRRARDRVATQRTRREARLALTSDLSAVADAVLQDEPVRIVGSVTVALARAHARADLAGRYVLTSTQVESAHTEVELVVAHEAVTALRADADRLLPEPVPRPAPATADRRRGKRNRR